MAGSRPLAAAAAAAAVVGLGVFPPGVEAAQVTLVPPRGGTPITLEDDQLQAIGAQRQLPGRGTVTGASVPELIDAAAAEASEPTPPLAFDTVFSHLSVAGAGQEVLLDEEQVDPSAIVYWDDRDTYFDSPSGERIAASAIEIGLRSGQLLEVRLEASKTKVKAGEKVEFRAEVVRSGAGQQLAYSWSLDGTGAAAPSPTITHSFDEPGSYDIVVSIEASGGDSWDNDVVTIQVGRASKKGPDRKGGGDNEHANAPDSGGNEGPSGSSDDGPVANESTAPPAAPKPTAPTAPEQPEEEREAVPPIGPAALVSGELLSSVSTGSPRSPLGQALRSALRTGSASADEATEGLGVPSVAGGLAATLVLLALGAGLEARFARGPGGGAAAGGTGGWLRRRSRWRV